MTRLWPAIAESLKLVQLGGLRKDELQVEVFKEEVERVRRKRSRSAICSSSGV
jgi:hypothetical protein